MKKAEFNKWVAEMVKRIDYKRFNTYRPAQSDTYIVFCFDNHTGKIGVARCNPSDNFNLDVGKAIAYARCRGYEVPKITTCKKISEMKNGDCFKKTNAGDCYYFIGKRYDTSLYTYESISTGKLFTCMDKGQEYEMVE